MDNTNDEQISDSVPKCRSLFAILAGLFLIGICLLFVAGAVSCFFHPTDPPVFVLIGMPFFLLLAWLAYKQYCILFCREPVASRAFHEAYIGFGIFMVFGAVMNFGEVAFEIQKGNDAIQKNQTGMIVVTGILVFGLLFLFIGGLLRSHTKQRQRPFLRSGQKFLTDQSGNKFRRRKMVGIPLMSVGVCLFAAYFVYSEYQYPVIGEHVPYEQLPHKGGFPPEGSDFSWRRGYRGTSYYEFTVSEEAFQHWISSETRWEYCEPIDGYANIPHSIHRLKDGEESPYITDGLCAGYGEGKGGRAVFDRSTNRAYYWTYY